MKKIILTSALALIFVGANAQTDNNNNNNNNNNKEESTKPKTLHKLGLHAGTTSGTGLSYKVDFMDKYQIQLVTLPIASKDYKWINTGIQFRYKFRNSGNWDFFSFGAANHRLTSERYSYYYDYNEQTSINHSLNASAGLAFEYGTSDAFKFNLQTGYGVYDITDNWTTMLSIGVGLDFTLNKL